MVSTGYRFVHYDAGDRRYRAAGPPRLLLRLIAPVVVVATVVVFVTGVELWRFGDEFGSAWPRLHQLSFVGCFSATAVHVLGYLGRAPSLAGADFRPDQGLSGRAARRSFVVASIVTVLVLATATAQRLSPFVHSPFMR